MVFARVDRLELVAILKPGQLKRPIASDLTLEARLLAPGHILNGVAREELGGDCAAVRSGWVVEGFQVVVVVVVVVVVFVVFVVNGMRWCR